MENPCYGYAIEVALNCRAYSLLRLEIMSYPQTLQLDVMSLRCGMIAAFRCFGCKVIRIVRIE